MDDNEKYIFQLVKVKEEPAPPFSKLVFQNENHCEDDLENKIKALETEESINTKRPGSPVINIKSSLKRKIEILCAGNIEEDQNIDPEKDVINLLSDNEDRNPHENGSKKVKIEPRLDALQKPNIKEEINVKLDNDFSKWEVFNVKQEYLGYDDEPISIESESDSESEHWYLRLSQNSPGKPFIKIHNTDKLQRNHEESSYSQMEDDNDNFINVPATDHEANEEDFVADLISIPEQVISDEIGPDNNVIKDQATDCNVELTKKDHEDSLKKVTLDEVDGMPSVSNENLNKSEITSFTKDKDVNAKRIQLIVPPTELSKRKYEEKSK